jgi:hypothetical protein
MRRGGFHRACPAVGLQARVEWSIRPAVAQRPQESLPCTAALRAAEYPAHGQAGLQWDIAPTTLHAMTVSESEVPVLPYVPAIGMVRPRSAAACAASDTRIASIAAAGIERSAGVPVRTHCMK